MAVPPAMGLFLPGEECRLSICILWPVNALIDDVISTVYVHDVAGDKFRAVER